jgi:hypothetical protein
LSFDSLKVHFSDVVDGLVREAGFGDADGITSAAGVAAGVGTPVLDAGFVDGLHATHATRTSDRIRAAYRIRTTVASSTVAASARWRRARLVAQGDRTRRKLIAPDEPEVERLAQAGERRRPVPRHDRVLQELIVVDNVFVYGNEMARAAA